MPKSSCAVSLTPCQPQKKSLSGLPHQRYQLQRERQKSVKSKPCSGVIFAIIVLSITNNSIQVECLDCGHKSRTFDFCLDYSISIQNSRQLNVQEIRQKYAEKKVVTQKQQVQEQSSDKKQEKKKRNRNKEKNQEPQEKQGIQEQQKAVEQQEQQEKQEQEQPKLDHLHKSIEFEGKIYDEISSQELQNVKVPYFDHDLQMLLEVTEKKEPEQVCNKKFSLKGCFDGFSEFELLDARHNFFSCDECKKSNRSSSKWKTYSLLLGRALRRFHLHESPQFATFVLKRFNQKANGVMEKISDFVEFPEFLDMADYFLVKGAINDDPVELIKDQREKKVYQLLGIVVHSGSLSSGHYVAYVRHGSSWFHFSDCQFREVPLSSVLNAQAYILFYERK